MVGVVVVLVTRVKQSQLLSLSLEFDDNDSEYDYNEIMKLSQASLKGRENNWTSPLTPRILRYCKNVRKECINTKQISTDQKLLGFSLVANLVEKKEVTTIPNFFMACFPWFLHTLFWISSPKCKNMRGPFFLLNFYHS